MTPSVMSLEDHPVVLYDGLCGLCDGVVQFLLQRDKKDVFRFAAQQSDFARDILKRHQLGSLSMSAQTSDAICVVENCGSQDERVYIKSEATLRIARGLGGIWRMARLVEVLPQWFADAGYDLIARNRYRIFGKRSECRVPAAEDQHRFLG